jgi:adenine-specific DNA methylase
MSQEPEKSTESTDVKGLPIERGFPIEQLNDIAEKEGYGGARQWYRPIYTMHKWWARRLGSIFRAISLYTLLDDEAEVTVKHPGENSTISDFDSEIEGIGKLISKIDPSNPDSLWELYMKDVTIQNKRVLDPFMGGGTSLIEASRFGAETVGIDINPVAWFVTKKEIDAGQTDVTALESAFSEVESKVKDELKSLYKTPCPNHPDEHNADVMNYFWVKELDCTSCSNTVSLFGDYRVAKGRYDNKGKYNVYCPNCESVFYVDDWQSESACTECGHHFVPKEGTVSGSKYVCDDCGQKYAITDAISEQNGYEIRLHAIEYHCATCDERRDYSKSKVKGYREATSKDRDLYQTAVEEWKSSPELKEFVPEEKIPEGHMTSDRNPLFDHGYSEWTDMFNERQLLSLSKLLKAIQEVENQNAREFLLLAFSDALRMNTTMMSYHHSNNQVNHIFKTNSFDPPMRPVEGNVWGAEYGTGTFKSIWDMVIRGVKWAREPVERYIEYPDKEGYPDTPVNSELNEPETVKTGKFSTPVGANSEARLGDVRALSAEEEFDAVITDPPYYDNIIYSEISDFFYVWLKIVLEDEYEGFDLEKTPRSDSIVANPFLDKGEEEFEDELFDAFTSIHNALSDDGVLTFTYHHSDSESWGELLEALCEVGFEVTATYPITADINKFISGEAVSFDIIVVARPAGERTPTSWNSLRRTIYRTARRTRKQLEESRNLSRGDIGVMEMGACFHKYSKHHGKVQRDGEIMSAKEVVQEIYGIIQEASDIGVEDVFIDLLDSSDPSFDDVNKLCRGTNATPEELKEMRLYNQDDDFELGMWDNEKRQAHIQERINGDSDDHLSNLDKLQFLRYRYEKGQAVQNYVDKWGVDDDLRELAGRLADVTDDDTYTRVLGDRDITSY